MLSGALDDGTAGLAVIKERGGVALAQDPADARYPGMPRSAIEHVAVDHVVPVAAMAQLLVRLAGAVPAGGLVLAGGQEPGAVVDTPLRDDASSGLICPDCGGALWSMSEGGVPRFRCRVGHAYSEEALLTAQGGQVETALWAALRTLEERAALLRRMAGRSQARGHERSARAFERQASDADRQAEIIRAGVLPIPVEAES